MLDQFGHARTGLLNRQRREDRGVNHHQRWLFERANQVFALGQVDPRLTAHAAIYHPLHLEHPDWLPIYDIVPDKAEVSKRAIFNLAAEEGVWVIGQHFPPFPSLGHVVKKGGGWEWQPMNPER